ncbi:3'-5' exonuclease [Candidatus Woesearchaeota archaeon]|nr:3'-5' exonuclease [Candidatus Woesearchaeota archaeon]
MIIVDVETTGFDPNKHSIVSIGAIDLENPNNQFYIENQIWDGAEIFEEDPLLPGPGYVSSLSVNGFTKEQIKDKNKPTLKEAIGLFLKWTESCNIKLLAGHNPYFDMDFLRSSALIHGMAWKLSYRTIDLHTVVYLSHKKRGLNPQKLGSTECFNYVGLPEEPKPHNALKGAKMEAEAFYRLIYGKPLLEEFKNYQVPDYLSNLAQK